MFKKISIFSALLGFALIGSAQATEITVTGYGKVMMDPDTYIIHLGVIKKESSLRDATKKAGDTVVDIKTNLAKANIDVTASISDGDLSFTEVFKTDEGKQKSDGWEARQVLIGKSASLQEAVALLQANTNAGATIFGGIEPSFKDQPNLEQKALKLAITDAKNKASAEAEAANVQLLAITSIKDVESDKKSESVIENGKLIVARWVKVVYDAK